MRKVMRILKANVLMGITLAAFLVLLLQVGDQTPLGSAREISVTIISFVWICLFGYAQFSR